MERTFSLLLLILQTSTFASIWEYPLYKQTQKALLAQDQKVLQVIDIKQAMRQDLSKLKTLSYKEARRVLHGKLHLEKSAGRYIIEDVYCQKAFNHSHGVGPDRIPQVNHVNTEHTWPKSRFIGSSQARKNQLSDLHHLFPADKRANTSRSNVKFGRVEGGSYVNKSCTLSLRGQSPSGEFIFQPPRAHRGNVARALFYFSVVYNAPISAEEEEVLREWHENDPVDSFERWRNGEIEKIQGNRNPFIDDPSMVDTIANF
jgi:endonuclease I